MMAITPGTAAWLKPRPIAGLAAIAPGTPPLREHSAITRRTTA